MIAVDALGGDFAPDVVLQGGLNAAYKGISIAFFGPQEIMSARLHELDAQWESLPIKLFDCTQMVQMADEPVSAVSQNRDASLVRGMQAVAANQCTAFVSAGNSGAALVAACLFIKRLPGVLRPALSVLLPTKNGGRCLLLDVGANIDCKPAYLEQFAYMGAAAAKSMLSLSHPRIALLSNGVEASKGNLVTKQAYSFLTNSSLNFVGNIEARYIFDGNVDVIACDGFVGNVLLKTAQGTARFMQESLKKSFGQSLWNSLLGLLNRPIFVNLKKQLDYAHYGGGVLLGVRKPVIVAHGSSNAYAIEQAILQAHALVQAQVIERVAESIAEYMTVIQAKQQSPYTVQ